MMIFKKMSWWSDGNGMDNKTSSFYVCIRRLLDELFVVLLMNYCLYCCVLFVCVVRIIMLFIFYFWGLCLIIYDVHIYLYVVCARALFFGVW